MPLSTLIIDSNDARVDKCEREPQPELGVQVWRKLQSEHLEKLEPIVGPYLSARSCGNKDPILDFLFEYYSFRPTHLLRWSPGVGRILAGSPVALEVDPETITVCDDHFFVDPGTFPARRIEGLRWMNALLTATSNKKPMFGCHGLHEWAMVYKMDKVRHPQYPLRLGREGTDTVVESQPLVCSHFDAFRFFTESAIPLNSRRLSRETSLANEQPGCLHGNMDLYKWAYKLYPWSSGELLADTFLLARDIRILDMQASPYDLSSIGVDPVKIETPEGRFKYREMQQEFAQRAAPLRTRLKRCIQRLLPDTGLDQD